LVSIWVSAFGLGLGLCREVFVRFSISDSYVINLIAPCFLIFLISFLGFFLPVESGEKVNLEITILLALVVFLLRVGETMPPTPDSIPILGASLSRAAFYLGSHSRQIDDVKV